MKNGLLLCMVCVCNVLLAQDWALFRTDKTSYYKHTSPYGDLLLYTANDSLNYFEEGYTIDFTKIFSLEDAGDCKEEITNQYNNGEFSDIYYITSDFFPYLDSIVMRNDTSFIYSESISYDMYFLQNAEIGEYWNILPDSYNYIHIKCLSIDTQTIFGLLDSVKTYSFNIFGPFWTTILEDYEIKLSKQFGLIEYINFNYLANHSETGTPTVISLIGFEDILEKYGYTMPEFQDYFDYDVGDKLYWQRNYKVSSPTSFQNYFTYQTDSIISKYVFTDSIEFLYNSFSKDTAGNLNYSYNQRRVFKKSEIGPLMQSPPNWICFSNNDYGGYSSYGQLEIWTSNRILLDESENTISRTFYTSQYLSDTNSCLIEFYFDEGWYLKMNDKVGIEEYSYGYWYTDITWSIIGYEIDGVLYGTTGIFDPHVNNKNYFSINPNPASDFIFIDIPAPFNYNYSIYTYTGKLIDNGMLTENRLDVAHLQQGMYFLQLKNDNGIAVAKFVKQ